MSAKGSTAAELLREWIGRQVSEQSAAWLDQQLEKLGAAPSDRDLDIGLGMSPRRLGKPRSQEMACLAAPRPRQGTIERASGALFSR